ncbi:MAG: bifunctional riboflavin kinase/FAD synthetase [Bacteroidetes bacterium]|nr:bifunctional riboflavin kinase/FAD synthetase [Bacteroidota bacterium]
MKIYNGLDNLKKIQNAVVTQGTFDGVHQAHKIILNKVKQLALEKNGESVVMTFEPHPRMVLMPDNHNLKLLTTLEEKKELLSNEGVQNLIVIPFTIELSKLHSQEFIKQIIVDKIGTKTLVIGYDHRFGKNREGSFEHLKKYSNYYGFEVEEVSEQVVDEIAVSSTKIRKALDDGNINIASKYLGRYYSLSGTVLKGLQLGKTIGFPTANLIINNKHKLIPRDGVYAVKIIFNNKLFGGMLNIGNNPTIEGKGRSIEVNIFNFSEDIYNQSLTLLFVDKLREEEKFNGIDALKTQLEKDKLLALEAILKNTFK